MTRTIKGRRPRIVRTGVSRSKRFNVQIIEVGDGIGFRPDANLAGLTEGCVSGVHDLLSIPKDNEPLTTRFNPQCMPHPAGDSSTPTGQLPAASVHHTIESHILFKGVGSGEVVVILVLVAEDESACLVPCTRDWLTLHGEPEVRQRRFISHSQWESKVCRVRIDLGQNLSSAWGIRFYFQDPLTHPTVPRPGEQKPCRDFARLSYFKIPVLLNLRSGDVNEQCDNKKRRPYTGRRFSQSPMHVHRTDCITER